MKLRQSICVLQGLNSVFEIYLEGGGGAFTVSPHLAASSASISVRVENASALNYETLADPVIELKVNIWVFF